MAIILDCFHGVGILFSMKHLFSIVSSHMWDLGPSFFSCSTGTSSLPEALLFFSNATPFLYSSSLKGSPSVVGGNTGHFGLAGMVPLSLTRHGGLDVVVVRIRSVFVSV